MVSVQDRGAALSHSYQLLGLSMTAMAQTLGLSVSRVSRLIAAAEGEGQAKGKT